MRKYVRLLGVFRKVDETFMECDGCHAVTVDPEAHLRWHHRSNVPIGKTYMGAAGWHGDQLWVELFEDADELWRAQNATVDSLRQHPLTRDLSKPDLPEVAP